MGLDQLWQFFYVLHLYWNSKPTLVSGSCSKISRIKVTQRNITLRIAKVVIQIKICAEYRDMLPRPRLVCQKPGLRPIGRSPGVPDKSSRGLGSMSRYSAQILICFIAYIFQFFFIPLWLWLGTLQDCQYAQCPLPLSIVIGMRLVIRQSKLPACLAEVQLAQQNCLI